MEVPFPELTILYLEHRGETVPVVRTVPDSFLGGSAPRLHILRLIGISAIKETTFVCQSAHLSLALGYSSIRVHVTQDESHLPFHFDRPRNSSPEIRIASTSLYPGEPMATHTDTYSVPRSLQVGVQRGQRISGGSTGPD